MFDLNFKISIIIPVYHETERINAFLTHLHCLGGTALFEIIVVDGAPENDTLQAIRAPAPKVILLSSRKGRAVQMNTGARAATGNILLFLHADTQLPNGALDDIKRFIDKGYEAGAFELKLDSTHPFLRFVSYTASLRSKFTKVPFGDQAIFIKADVFRTAGGYKEIPLMEEIDLMKRLKKKGCRTSIINKPVISSARKWEKEGMLRNTFKNHLVRLLYSIGLNPVTLEKIYYGKY